MRLPALLLATVAMLPSSQQNAWAQSNTRWRIEAFKDQMTDKTEVEAALKADGETGAELRVTCQRMEFFPTALSPFITFPTVIGFGDIGINHRFDDSKVVIGIRKIGSNGRVIHLWLGDGEATASRIRKSKRLRVEVFPRGQGSIFLNFDLAGSEVALSKIPCGPDRRRSSPASQAAPDPGR